jgi:hypothetical protein
MEEQRIEFETAKLAFDKGLRRRGELIKEGKTLKINLDGIKCNTCFNLQGNPTTPKYVHNDQQYVRPTQTLLQKWLREKHGIKLWCEPHEFSSSDGWAFNLLARKEGFVTVSKGNQASSVHLTYEQALEEGLQEGLKLIP